MSFSRGRVTRWLSRIGAGLPLEEHHPAAQGASITKPARKAAAQPQLACALPIEGAAAAETHLVCTSDNKYDQYEHGT